MARVPYLDEQDLKPEDRYLLARPINIFRALANSPAALRNVHAFGEWIRWNSSLESRLRELVILEVGRGARSEYEYSHHAKIALEFGATPADINALQAHAAGESTTLSELDRAALDAARAIQLDGQVPDPTWAILESELGPELAVELVVIASHYAMVVRLLTALEIETEPEFQVYSERFPLR